MTSEARIYIGVREGGEYLNAEGKEKIGGRIRIVEKLYVPIAGTKSHEGMFTSGGCTYILSTDAQIFDIELRKHRWSFMHEYPVYLYEKDNPAPIKRGGEPLVVIDADELDDMVEKHTVRDLARGMMKPTFDPIQLLAGGGVGFAIAYIAFHLVK